MRRFAISTCLAAACRWPVNFRCNADVPLIVGNKSLGLVRDADVAKITLSDFVGTFDVDERKKASAGSIMSYLDLCGVRTAITFIAGYETWDRGLQNSGLDIVISTMSFNAFMFRRPVYAGDLVVVNGSVIFAGNSSIGVFLDVARQGYECATPSYVGDCYLTFVCVNKKDPSRTIKNVVPALRLTSPVDKERYNLYSSMRQSQQKNLSNNETDIQDKFIEDDINKIKPIKVTIAETTTFGTRMFNPCDLNINDTIFGGSIICWMEEHALHCGRLFSGCPHVYTIGMHDMMFDKALYPSDCTKLKAKVVYVRHTTMEVEVNLCVERNGNFVTSNRACFVLICMLNNGKKIPIDKGLDLERSSAEDVKAYVKARWRYQYSSEMMKRWKSPSI